MMFNDNITVTGIALEALAGVVSLADAEVDPSMVCMPSLLG